MMIGAKTNHRGSNDANISGHFLSQVGQVLVDDSGWKQVHGDVFRAPRYADRVLPHSLAAAAH